MSASKPSVFDGHSPGGMTKKGDVEFTCDPNWEPLLQYLTREQCGDWFWMCRENIGRGRIIQHYKHRQTKQYVCLDAKGRAWRMRRTWFRGRVQWVRAKATERIAAASAGW